MKAALLSAFLANAAVLFPAAAQPIDRPVLAMPPATSPLTGAEYIYCVQGGAPRRCSAFMISPAFGPAGIDGGGSVDNSTALQAALTAAQSAGQGVIHLPCGAYRVLSGLTVTLAADSHLRVTGDGRCTRLLGSGFAGNLLSISYGAPSSSASIQGLTFTTDGSGTQTAINLVEPGNNTAAAYAAANDITDVSIYGSDWPTNHGLTVGSHWFANGIIQNNVSNLNLTNVTIEGGGAGSYSPVVPRGNGIYLTGNVGTSYAVLTNTNNLICNQLNACVVYGDWYQGFQAVNANMTGNNHGIWVLCGTTINGELSVANSQFGNFLDDVGFAPCSTLFYGVNLSNNYFLLWIANTIEVLVQTPVQNFTFTGNAMTGGGGTIGGTFGLGLNSNVSGNASGNVFDGFSAAAFSGVGDFHGLVLGPNTMRRNALDYNWAMPGTSGLVIVDPNPRTVSSTGQLTGLACNAGNVGSQGIASGVGATQTWSSPVIPGGTQMFRVTCDPIGSWKAQ
jgi:hypothetical protein